MGSEEGGSYWLQNTESICILCFVFSQFGADKESITMTWIKPDVWVRLQMIYKQ